MTVSALLPDTFSASMVPLPFAQVVPLGEPRPGLSRRELQVLALVAEGMTNKEIGQHLYVSTNTVNKHVGGVLIKLGARNRARAAAMYQQTQPVA